MWYPHCIAIVGVYSVIGAELETLALLRIRSMCLCFGGWLTQSLYSDSTVHCTMPGVSCPLSLNIGLLTHTRPRSPVVNCQWWCTTSDIIPRSNNIQMLEVTLNRSCGYEQVCPLFFPISLLLADGMVNVMFQLSLDLRHEIVSINNGNATFDCDPDSI